MLKGLHYGTPADVFSFAIVMSEVVALQPPYADMMTGDDAVSMGKIVEMTKSPTSIRPTLPDEIDDGLAALINDSWNAEPSLRPSFEVIAMRLRMVAKAVASSHSVEKDELEGLLRANKTGLKRDEEGEKREAVVALCQSIHEALWHAKPGLWDERAAVALVRDDTAITASDPILNDIVKAARGSKAIRSCGQLMIGNMEDGSEVIPFPLMKDDVVIDLEKGNALLTARFSVSTAKRETGKSSWSFKAKKEFDGLLEHALAEQAAESKTEQTPLQAAVEMKAGEGARAASGGKAKKRKLLKKKKAGQTSPGGLRSKKAKKGSLEEIFEHFVKAARFVRFGDGVGLLHPSFKLRLFGLMMQAQHGDCRDSATQDRKPRRSSAASSLEQLKRAAWASQKGKKRKEAMEEYVKALSEIAPQWKLANLMAGRNGAQDEISKPRRMMWVIRVDFAQGGEGRRGQGVPRQRVSGALPILVSLRATSLHIVQGANASQTKQWFEDRASQRPKGKDKGGIEMEEKTDFIDGDFEDDENNGVEGEPREKEKEKEKDPFLAILKEDFTVDDCLVDVGGKGGKFKTVEQQHEHFVEKMLLMAREGKDDEDGWKLLSRLEPEGMDVHERDVDWSPVAQLRSRWTASCGVDKVGEYLLLSTGTWTSRQKDKALRNVAKDKALRDVAKGKHGEGVCLFVQRKERSLLMYYYRTLAAPWPLSSRDMVSTFAYLFPPSIEGTFVGYVLLSLCPPPPEDFTDSHLSSNRYTFSSNRIPKRTGYVRATVKYQGLVVQAVPAPAVGAPAGASAKAEPAARVTFLANLDLGGSVRYVCVVPV